MEKRTVEIKNTQPHGGKDLMIKSGDNDYRISSLDTQTIELEEGRELTIRFDGDAERRSQPRGDVARAPDENRNGEHGNLQGSDKNNPTGNPNPNAQKR